MTAGEHARRYLEAKLSVLPVRADGSKAPAVAAWRDYQRRLPTADELRDWFADEALGVAVVCGEVSGHLGVVDVEFDDVFEEFFFLLREELGAVAAQLPQVRTPGKSADQRGRHLYFRSAVKVATRKLARIPADEARRRTGDRGKTTAIEIKAEGGYVLAPGCPAACHESGRLYELAGDAPLERVPTLDEEQVRAVLRCARVLDRGDQIKVEYGGCEPPVEGEVVDAERPGDEFNRTADWPRILEPHGWKVYRRHAGTTYWTRPGKDQGVSATTGHCSNERSGDLLYVFSTNAEPLSGGRAYSKFGAWSTLEHGSDFDKAAAELARHGFGELRRRKKTKAKAEPKVETNGYHTPEYTAAPFELNHKRQEFPVEALPADLAEYAGQMAESYSCPVDFPCVAMLGVASVAVGASRAIEVTPNWIEYPSLYMAVVADPGSAKTPVFNEITAPMCRMQHGINERWGEERDKFEAEHAAWEFARKKAATKGDAFAEPRPKRPTYRHLYTNNSTIEALVPMLAENPRGFGLIADEASGWMLSMNQYKKGGKGDDRQFWLSLWSGVQQKTDRKSNREQGPLIAARPFMSILCGIQPDMIGELCDERGREDGFVHRFLFSFPEAKPWADDYHATPNPDLQAYWREVYTWLLGCQQEFVPGEPPSGVRLSLTPDADALALRWWKDHTAERNADDFNQALDGPWSKMRAYFWRVALVLHMLRLATGETTTQQIDEQSIIRAALVLNYFKSHATMVYPRLRQKMEDRLADRAIRWVRRHNGEASARDLLGARIVTRQSTGEELLKDLQDRGLGKIEARKPEGSKGWKINVFKAFPEPHSEQSGE